MENQLANFVKAIAMGIFNETTAGAMAALEQQKKELDSAIQAEHVKVTLFEDEASIGSFYQRFAHATMDTAETRDLLFDYFVDKIFVGAASLTIASWFFDHGAEFTLDDLHSMRQTGEVLNVEFNTSPWGGGGGNRTRVLERRFRSSPGAAVKTFYSASALQSAGCRQAQFQQVSPQPLKRKLLGKPS